MAEFEDLKRRYMLEGIPGTAGGSISGGGRPAQSFPARPGSLIAPIIGGQNYFSALKSTLSSLSGPGSFCYMTGWRFTPDFSLDGPGGQKLSELLTAKSSGGMDVRVLGWVMAPQVLTSRILRAALAANAPGLDVIKAILGEHDMTMEFIRALRAEKNLAPKAALNVLPHPAGAVHQKFVLAGDTTKTFCFTGGLDCVADRALPSWHDVQVQASGPVVQDCFDAFRAMWNEVRGRRVQSLTGLKVTIDSRSGSMPDLPASSVAAPVSGKAHAQSLRTSPAMNFGAVSSTFLPVNDQIAYAPDGLFEVRLVWEKAIKAASRYIYIEDQGFWSTEVFDWVNTTLQANPDMKVVLVTAPDPADEGNTLMGKLLRNAIARHLVKGMSDADINNRIGLFWRKGGAVHSKTTIVDDAWAIAGSANSFRRGLYTDLEHSIAWMDEENGVPTYRMDLWGAHLLASIPDLDDGLSRWFSIPFRGTSGAASHLPVERLDTRPAAMPPVNLTSDEQMFYDSVYDVDSRQVWGPAIMAWMLSKVPGLVSP